MVETRPLFDMMLYVHDLDDYYYIRQSENRIPDIDNEVALHTIYMSKIESIHPTVSKQNSVIYTYDSHGGKVPHFVYETYEEVNAAYERYLELKMKWELKKNEILDAL